MSHDEARRKGVQVTRLIAAVDEYFRAFGPVPMKVLSARFGKSLNALGGFPETIEELRRDGTFTVVLQKSGAKLVTPGDAVVADPGPAAKKSG